MIVVTISSHAVSCSQGGSAHLGVGVIAITTLCTAASSIAQELVAHRRMSKGTCMILFTILKVTSHINLADRLPLINSGFSIIRCDRMSRAGGGVCVYVSNSTTYDICLTYSNSVCELLTVKIHNPALIIILMYHPPSCPAEAFNDIISRSQALILSMPSPLPNIIMLGDFNFHDIDWTNPDLSCAYAIPLLSLSDCLFLNQQVL